MISKIVDIALANRAVILVLVAALIVAGLLSIQRLPFDADPDISPLQVLVTTQAPGLAPLDVERSITAPIELALQGLPGMTSYRSISRYGLSVIYVKFADGGDILTDRALVAQRLEPDGAAGRRQHTFAWSALRWSQRDLSVQGGRRELLAYAVTLYLRLADRATAQAGPRRYRGQRKRR